VTRFRHARGVERQQLRWVTLAAALTGVAMLATGVLVAVGDLVLAGWTSVIGTVFLPLAAGAAILRYRLYDLDRIISRTLAYGLLTVLLGGGYALVALVLGQLLGRDSSLVVAAATLAVVDQTMQPTRARLWLRPPGRPGRPMSRFSGGAGSGGARRTGRPRPPAGAGCWRPAWTGRPNR
jgi:peptidoglycan/LPS O-acetylase OafA/YrhL